MLLVLLLAPLLTGFVRKVKARLLRRRGPSVIQPYRDLLRLLRKEVVLAENASWLFRAAPYLIFAATWVAAALVPTFATGLAVQLVGRPDRDRRAARQRPLLPGARRARRRHQLRRHRLEPRDDDRLARRAGDDHGRLHARRCSPARPSSPRSPTSCWQPDVGPARLARPGAGRADHGGASRRTPASRSTTRRPISS